LQSGKDYELPIKKMRDCQINYTELNKNDTLFGYLV
jgi:hypothetical protein